MPLFETSDIHDCTHRFYHYAERGNLSKLNELILNHKLDIDYQYQDPNKQGRTALMAAAINGHADVVVWMLEHGLCDVDAKDHGGNTALMLACDEPGIVTKLLARFANWDSVNEHGETALILAVKCECAYTIQVLLEHSADLGTKDRNGHTALDYAYEMGSTICIDLIEAFTRNRAFHNLIHKSSTDNDILNELKQYYTENERWIDTEWRNPERNGHTALLLAAQYNSLSTVSWLLSHTRCDINCISYRGATPLILATTHGNRSMVQLLLSYHSCNVNIQDGNGSSALLESIKLECYSITALLISHGADIHLHDHKGNSPWSVSCTMDPSSIRFSDALLCTCKCNSRGDWTLSYNEQIFDCVSRNELEKAKDIWKHHSYSVDMEWRIPSASERHNTILMHAISLGCEQFVQWILVDIPAPWCVDALVHDVNDDGETVFTLAFRFINILKMLLRRFPRSLTITTSKRTYRHGKQGHEERKEGKEEEEEEEDDDDENKGFPVPVLLKHAAEKNCPDAVKLLLHYGADCYLYLKFQPDIMRSNCSSEPNSIVSILQSHCSAVSTPSRIFYYCIRYGDGDLMRLEQFYALYGTSNEIDLDWTPDGSSDPSFHNPRVPNQQGHLSSAIETSIAMSTISNPATYPSRPYLDQYPSALEYSKLRNWKAITQWLVDHGAG